MERSQPPLRARRDRKYLVWEHQEYWLVHLARAFTRWWFTFAKDFAIVIGIKILADWSSSVLFRGLYYFSYLALVVFCLSYVHGLILNLVPSTPSVWVDKALDVVFTAIMLVIIAFAIHRGIQLTIDILNASRLLPPISSQ